MALSSMPIIRTDKTRHHLTRQPGMMQADHALVLFADAHQHDAGLAGRFAR